MLDYPQELHYFYTPLFDIIRHSECDGRDCSRSVPKRDDLRFVIHEASLCPMVEAMMTILYACEDGREEASDAQGDSLQVSRMSSR